MQNQKLSIRFILFKSRKNVKGKSPIYCRLTYEKERKNFSTGELVKEVNWSTKLNHHRRLEHRGESSSAPQGIFAQTSIKVLLKFESFCFPAHSKS